MMSLVFTKRNGFNVFVILDLTGVDEIHLVKTENIIFFGQFSISQILLTNSQFSIFFHNFLSLMTSLVFTKRTGFNVFVILDLTVVDDIYLSKTDANIFCSFEFILKFLLTKTTCRLFSFLFLRSLLYQFRILEAKFT